MLYGSLTCAGHRRRITTCTIIQPLTSIFDAIMLLQNCTGSLLNVCLFMFAKTLSMCREPLRHISPKTLKSP